MERQKIRFSSTEQSQSPFRVGRDKLIYTLRGHRPRRVAEKEGVSAGSMLVKLGLCAAACAMVVVLNQKQTQSVYTSAAEEEEFDDSLGKLHFVEMPGLLSVFAREEKMALPMLCSAYELLEEGTLLRMRAAKTQALTAPEACTVKSIGEDAALGSFVCLRAADDREWSYYGLEGIGVEEGQRLQKNDALGKVESGATAYLRMCRGGRPEDLRSHIALGMA